jgi:glycine/D-amino acid oxidase-like deaminating enzyme
MSRVIVLGAGVIGITTAYEPSQAGHRVTVIERNAHAGRETRYSNGGQLSYSDVAPLAGPGVTFLTFTAADRLLCDGSRRHGRHRQL